jgi:hypothetical protein
MHDRQDDDLVTDVTEVDSVRKPTQERAPCVTFDARIGTWVLKDCGERCLERRGEDAAQSEAFSLVPSSRVE